MKRPNLRIEKFTNLEKSFTTERYVVETKKELKALLKEFPQLNNNFMKIQETWEGMINEGRILLITDESIAGFPTYRFEDKGKPDAHTLIRI